MTVKIYRIRHIEGLTPSDGRGVVFLTCEQDVDLDASAAFDDLSEKKERELRDRLDLWIEGCPYPRYHHGWKDPEYSDCYVFKLRQKKDMMPRFYGFLSHPDPSSPRFLLCVLFAHATKSGKYTDKGILKRANELRVDPDVVSVVEAEFANKY